MFEQPETIAELLVQDDPLTRVAEAPEKVDVKISAHAK